MKRKLVLLSILITSILFLSAPGVQSAYALVAGVGAPGTGQPVFTMIEGKIEKQPLYNELVARGVAPNEVLCLARSFKEVFDFKNSRPNDTYCLYLTKENTLQRFIYKTGPLNEYIAEKSENGSYSISKLEISLTRQVAAKEFTIETSLYNAIKNGGEKHEMTCRFADLFSWDIDFYLYPRKGDKIRILFEKYLKDDEFVRYGDILAAQYIGERGTFHAYLFRDDEFYGYYDEEGRPLRKMFLRNPVKFGVRTSSFSVRRFHPKSKIYKAHNGIDYGARHGSPILATASGRVQFSGWRGGYGKLVILKHPNGYDTYYGHCSKLLVKKGQLVDQSQAIARIGETGVATGPHVHYEVRIHGKPINPNRIKRHEGKPIQAETLEKYKRLAALLRLDLEDRLAAGAGVESDVLASREKSREKFREKSREKLREK